MEPHSDLVRRWRYLRGLLIEQLELFDNGGLTMRSGGVDVSADAMAKLRRSIAEFDALIAGDEAEPG